MKLLHRVSKFFLALSCVLSADALAGTASSADSSLVVDSTTCAMWHFDEASGSLVADQTGRNPGSAVGTTIVQGWLGYARSFNGTGDIVFVSSDSSLNLDTLGFAIELSIRTTTTQNSMIMRKGLAPTAGFLIAMTGGKIFAQIGNRGDSYFPDTLLTIMSSSTYNDGAWHNIRLFRDRLTQRLHLYIDGVDAAQPVHDPVTFRLNNDRPLSFGGWENPSLPDYFEGSIDEAKMIKFTYLLSIPRIDLQYVTLNFGTTRVGTTDSLDLRLVNVGGGADSLKISSIVSTSPAFSMSVIGSLVLGKHDTTIVRIRYAPQVGGRDTASIEITSNDPLSPVVTVPVRGNAYELGHAPIFSSITLVPNNSYRARAAWIRTVDDSVGAADQTTQYSIWRRITGLNAPGSAREMPASVSGAASVMTPLWDFVMTVPAAGFDEYAAVVPVPSNYQNPYAWTTMMVIAHTVSGKVYTSNIDSVQINHPIIMDVGSRALGRPGQFGLEQNFPNPFNPTTTIQYTINDRQSTSLRIFDLLGREVAVLVNEVREPGTYSITWNASGSASNVYFCRLTSGPHVEIRKMVLVK